MIPPVKDLRAAYFRTLVICSAFLVLTTLVFRFRTEFFLWLVPLSLGEENVVAAWFSGTLLLLAGLHAGDGAFRLRHEHPKAALAWCVISAMLLFLSADEIACLHERIEHLKPGPALSFVPFIIVLLAGCAWSFLQLWKTPTERPKVRGLILGFALLVSVGGQEVIERFIAFPWYLRPLRTALEEGSELGGMLVLIYTTLPNSLGLFPTTVRAEGAAFSGLASLRWLIVLLVAILAWPLAGLTASMDAQADLGHFSDWLSCVLFTSSAALIVRRWAQSPQREGFPSTIVILLLAASAICVQFDPVGDHDLFPSSSTIRVLGFDLNTRLVLLALCCLGAAEALRAEGRRYRAGALLAVCAGLLSAVFSAYSTPDALWWGYFATTAVAVVTFAALAVVSESVSSRKSVIASRPGTSPLS
jgi:hypothetical protein